MVHVPGPVPGRRHFLHRGVLGALAVLSGWLLLSSQAAADYVGAEVHERIVINSGVGSAGAIALGTPHPAVVQLTFSGFLCSGVLITPNHVLTAQHCTFGQATSAFTVSFHTDNDGTADATRTVSSKFEPDANNTLLDGTDIAILQLASAAPGNIIPLDLLADTPASVIGSTGTLVGFGLQGVGNAGASAPDGKRWAAENVVDAFGAARASGGGAMSNTANIFNTDYDDGTTGNNTLSPGVTSSATPLTHEGTTAGGDSGGPLLIGGLVAGVLSGGTTANSILGDISWWTGVLQHRTFIETNASGAQFRSSAVPEPSSLALAAIGLVGAAWTAQRRRRAASTVQ